MLHVEAVIPKVVRSTEKKPEVKIQPEKQFNPSSSLTLDIVKKSWKDILESFKARRMMVIYASLSPGKPDSCKSGIVTVKFAEDFAFNKPRLEKEENRKYVEEIFSLVLKENVKVQYKVDRKEDIGKSSEDILKETFGESIIQIKDE